MMENSPDFVKEVTTTIYGAERTSRFDPKSGCWPTESRVQASPIDPEKDAVPYVTTKFDEITQGKQGVPGVGGVFVICPVHAANFAMLAQKVDLQLRNSVFKPHVHEFAELVHGCKPVAELDHSVACLLPGYLSRQGE